MHRCSTFVRMRPVSRPKNPERIGDALPRKFVLLAALVVLVAAIFSTGTHHADEHFQILEFANAKLGLSPVSDLPWEYAERMRPALQPTIVVALHHALSAFGPVDPFVLAFVLRLLSGALWLLATVQLLRALMPAMHDDGSGVGPDGPQRRGGAERAGESGRRWLIMISFFLWFAVYDAVRFSSENWSGSFFVLGLAMVLLKRDAVWQQLIAGVALGLAVVLRLPSLLLVAGLLGWLVFMDKRGWRMMAALTAGILIALAFGIIVDCWFYGEWVLTAWRYFDLNVLQGRASGFGTEPWWWYFTAAFERGLPPFSIVLIVAPLLVIAFDRRKVIAWVLLPYLLAHFAIGHKELRFLFPLIGLLPYCLVRGAEIMRANTGGNWLRGPVASWLLRIAWAVNLVALAVVMVKPADADMPLYRHLWRSYPQPVTMLHTGFDPYQGVDAKHFYRRPGWVMGGAFEAEKEYVVGPPSIIITRERGFAEHPPMGWVVVYSSLPAWVDRFNFNGWVDRTERWYVLEQRPR